MKKYIILKIMILITSLAITCPTISCGGSEGDNPDISTYVIVKNNTSSGHNYSVGLQSMSDDRDEIITENVYLESGQSYEYQFQRVVSDGTSIRLRRDEILIYNPPFMDAFYEGIWITLSDHGKYNIDMEWQ